SRLITTRSQPIPTLVPYTTLFRSNVQNNGAGATVGVQRGTGSLSMQFECNTGGLASGVQLAFTVAPCLTYTPTRTGTPTITSTRSEEHTSELQSRFDLVCRLLLDN